MKLNDLRIDIETEFSLIRDTLSEINEIKFHLFDNLLSKSDVTAGATYLAQCYNGYENILKRIIKYIGFPMPSGAFWHVELLSLFIESPEHNALLPVLIRQDFFPAFTALRKIRHTVVHGYAIRLGWEFIATQFETVGKINDEFKLQVMSFIESIQENL